jgi:outer membrane protein assembly factor BamB
MWRDPTGRFVASAIALSCVAGCYGDVPPEPRRSVEILPWRAEWRAPLPFSGGLGWVEPVVADGTVYITNGGQAGAADAATGQWRWWSSGPSTGGPLVVTRDAVIRGGDLLVAVGRTDGRVLWARATPGNIGSANKSADDTHVYTGSMRGWVYAARLADGSTTWQVKPLGDSLDVRGTALSGDTLYVGGKKRLFPDTLAVYSTGSAVVVALDARTGRTLARWDDVPAPPDTDLAWPALLTDSLVIFGQVEGDHVIALHRRTLREVWRTSVGAENLIGVASRLVVRGDTLFGASNPFLIAVRKSTGRVLWRDRTRGGRALAACGGQLVSSGPSVSLTEAVANPTRYYFAALEEARSNAEVASDGQRVFVEGNGTLSALSCAPR